MENVLFAPVVKVGCESDSECPSQLACINAQCKNPCEEGRPCGINAECRVLDTLPVRTMLCECLPGYRGNAAVQCDLRKKYFQSSCSSNLSNLHPHKTILNYPNPPNIKTILHQTIVSNQTTTREYTRSKNYINNVLFLLTQI